MDTEQGNTRGFVSVLVTDLDNTLWDWFELWYSGFKPFFDALVKKLAVSEAVLKAEIKEVHSRHQTSEYSLLLQELPSVHAAVPKEFDPYQEFGDVIEAYKEGRKRASQLYPGVLETLKTVRSQGSTIVGFTESQFFYTTQRIRVLGLDGIVDVLYTTHDRGLPALDEIRQIRKKPDEYYELHQTKTTRLPGHAKKPDPGLLDLILGDVGAKPEDAIYVGDNLYKDVLMAKQAGIRAVHAAYGEAHRDSRYEFLRDVTHWAPTDVNLEKSAKQDGIQPDYALGSFADLLNLFEFVPFRGK